MKHIARIFANPLLAGFFMSVALLFGCGGGGSDSRISIEIHGDSIPFGPGIERNVAAQIRVLRPGWEVIDVSASGLDLLDVINGYAEPFKNAPREAFPAGPQPPIAQRPLIGRYQVIEVGGNDALGMRDPAVYEAGLRHAIKAIQTAGRVPVLTGIVNAPPGDFFTPTVLARRDELNAITLRLAAELGLQHAGWGEDYRGEVDVIHDRIHRTQVASDRLAALLVAAIDRAAEKR